MECPNSLKMFYLTPWLPVSIVMIMGQTFISSPDNIRQAALRSYS